MWWLRIKITDFGLATIIDPHKPEIVSCGSAGYLAPEVYAKTGYNCKADIFSLGIILFTM